jgi:hypothetical protein
MKIKVLLSGCFYFITHGYEGMKAKAPFRRRGLSTNNIVSLTTLTITSMAMIFSRPDPLALTRIMG